MKHYNQYIVFAVRISLAPLVLSITIKHSIYFSGAENGANPAAKIEMFKLGLTNLGERSRSIQNRHEIARFSHKSRAKRAVFAFSDRMIGHQERHNSVYGAKSGAKRYFHANRIARKRHYVNRIGTFVIKL